MSKSAKEFVLVWVSGIALRASRSGRTARVALFLCLVLAGFLFSTSRSSAALNEQLGATLEPIWQTGILSDGVGPRGIVSIDLNQDNLTDTIACVAEGSAYVLNKGLTTYQTRWYSPALNCTHVNVGDRDGNQHLEIYIGTSDSKVHIFSGDDFSLLGVIALPDSGDVKGLELANVDNDSGIEIVIVREDATFVYDATTLVLEWNVAGKGGNELAIGNIEGDSNLEIVVNGNPAHILDAYTKTEKWAYSGGFGIDMGLGNLDNDAFDEIGYVVGGGYSDSTVYAMDLDTLTQKWHYDEFGMQIVIVADADKNGMDEVIVGDGQWGAVHGHYGIDGAIIYSVSNPESGVDGIAVGDPDNDGKNELLWGAGIGSSGTDALFIGAWDTELVEWQTPDLDVPFHATAGDIDNDGDIEFVSASISTESSYEGGTVSVYDYNTRKLEWSLIVGSYFWDINHVALGQVDDDSALEIVVGGENWYDTRIQVIDGVTRTKQWESAALSRGGTRGLIVENIDGDATDEIIVGVPENRINIFNGATNVLQWDSGPLDSLIWDFDLGDLDGDGSLELAVLTWYSVYTFNAPSMEQDIQQPISSGRQIAITNGDLSGPGELLIATRPTDTKTRLEKWSGAPLVREWSKSLGDVYVNDIAVGELDGDGTQEFILGGSYGDPNFFYARSFLAVGSFAVEPFIFESKSPQNYSPIQNIVVTDLGDGGAPEVVTGNFTLVQSNKVSVGPLTVPEPKIVTLADEHFEKGFPGAGWVAEKGWGMSKCQAAAGKKSAWAVQQQNGKNCSLVYPNNSNNWMVFGPFSLKKAKKAMLEYSLWLKAESQKDMLFVGASLDNENFYGKAYTGVSGSLAVADTALRKSDLTVPDLGLLPRSVEPDQTLAVPGWSRLNLDLNRVLTLGNLTGQDQVWIGFLWTTDGQNGRKGGAFVDDVLLTKQLKK